MHLMREAIRGHQRSSEVIRGHQRSSEVIRGNQPCTSYSEPSSEAIRSHPKSSEAIRGHQRQSAMYLVLGAVRGNQRSSEVIRGHQPCTSYSEPSEAIRGNQRSSEVIRHAPRIRSRWMRRRPLLRGWETAGATSSTPAERDTIEVRARYDRGTIEVRATDAPRDARRATSPRDERLGWRAGDRDGIAPARCVSRAQKRGP